MTKGLLLLTMAAASGLGATAAFGQSARFDGNWSVVVLTQKGECNPTARFPIIIEGGQARYGGSIGVDVRGTVAPSGAVRGSIGGNGANVNVAGRLAGAAGRGTWTSAGSVACSGRWEAEKRG